MMATKKGFPTIDRTIVLVGLMGAGKTCIGKRLAENLNLPFFDSDREIEGAAGCSISDIFRHYGEAAFRDCERKIITRIMNTSVSVLASGGGAFMNEQTRDIIARKGVSLWLRADLDLLVSRTAGRTHRPILMQGDGREILAGLIEKRYPVYANADIIVDSTDTPPDVTVKAVMRALRDYFRQLRRKQ